MATVLHEYFHKTCNIQKYLTIERTKQENDFFTLEKKEFHSNNASLFEEFVARTLSEKIISNTSLTEKIKKAKDQPYQLKIWLGVKAFYPPIKNYIDNESSSEETLEKLIKLYKKL